MTSSGAHVSSVGISAEPPRRLGRYEVLAKLASGGMATVYLGRARGAAGFERVLAIKHCHPHLMDDQEFRAMFLDEARLAARIHHPNVVSTIDVSEENGLYLVMEYIEGGRVSDLMAAARAVGRPIPIEVALRIAVDGLAGLHAAHETTGATGEPLHIVHRDVSPQNLIVGVDGVTRVADFGVAKAEARATVTSNNQVKGKVGYMAPEQLMMRDVTPRSDVYAAGVVLWELLTGTRLVRGDSREESIQRAISQTIASPRSMRQEAPESVDKAVMRALCRRPDDRFESAEAFADALEVPGVAVASHRAVGAFVRELLAQPIEARRGLLRSGIAKSDAPPPPAASADAASGVVSTQTRQRARRRTWIVATALALVLLGLGVATAVAFRSLVAPEPDVSAPASPVDTEEPAPVDPTEPAVSAETEPETEAEPETEIETETEAEADVAEPELRAKQRRPRPSMRRGMRTGEFRPSTI